MAELINSATGGTATYYPNTAVRLPVVSVLTYRGSAHGLGVRNRDGSLELVSVERAVAMQESGRLAFYTRAPGEPERDLVVIRRRDGSKYLRTSRDLRMPNNLALLPEWEEPA
jgi:hypothetical protein